MRRVLTVRQGPDLVLAIVGGDASLSLTHDEARALATMLDAVCDAEPYPPQIRPPAVEPWEDGPPPRSPSLAEPFGKVNLPLSLDVCPRAQNDFGRGAP